MHHYISFVKLLLASRPKTVLAKQSSVLALRGMNSFPREITDMEMFAPLHV